MPFVFHKSLSNTHTQKTLVMHLYLSLSLTLIMPVKPRKYDCSAMVGESTCYSPIYSVNHTNPSRSIFFFTFYCFSKKVGTVVNHGSKINGAYQR